MPLGQNPPIPNRDCQCRLTRCPCSPCVNTMTAEDLLCDLCRRESKLRENDHCHDVSDIVAMRTFQANRH